jgi:C-terminal processing protease CtpA/Prc
MKLLLALLLLALAFQYSPATAQESGNVPDTNVNVTARTLIDLATAACDSSQLEERVNALLRTYPFEGIGVTFMQRCVTGIWDDGPADSAGIRMYDYVISINGDSAEGDSMLIGHIQTAEVITLLVQRDDRTITAPSLRKRTLGSDVPLAITANRARWCSELRNARELLLRILRTDVVDIDEFSNQIWKILCVSRAVYKEISSLEKWKHPPLGEI